MSLNKSYLFNERIRSINWLARRNFRAASWLEIDFTNNLILLWNWFRVEWRLIQILKRHNTRLFRAILIQSTAIWRQTKHQMRDFERWEKKNWSCPIFCCYFSTIVKLSEWTTMFCVYFYFVFIELKFTWIGVKCGTPCIR